MTDKKNEVKNEQAFDLESESELRIEIEEENIAFLTLKSGTAEIFGSELILDKPITLNHGSKIAVYTWHGCNILLRVENIIKENSHIHKLNVNKEENDDDNVDNKNLIDYIAYISKETPNICYANTHAVLERMRRSAKEKTTRGPRVMIVGPVDVGKSSLCALLLNYAVRMGWKPIYVDLDVGQGSISIPGNLSAIQVEKTIDIEESYYLYSNTASPMVIHFGRISPGDNIKLYLHCITVLSQIVEKKCTDKPRVNQSGIIINTCGWVKQQGYLAITHAAQAFEVDLIIVLDQERVYNELKRDMPPFVKVTLLPKSGGIVSRTKTYRSQCRDKRIKEYFYGHSHYNSSISSLLLNDRKFFPHSFEVRFDEVKLYRIGNKQNEILPDSCLPLGVKVKDQNMSLFLTKPSFDLLHHIASLSMAQTDSEEDILNANVAGFICITDIKMDKETMTILSPQSRPLPYNTLLLSQIQFIDYT